MPIITPLPSPPSTSDPVNFASEADAHILALQTFTTEINAFGADLAGAGIITPTRDSIVANATTTDLWNNSKIQDWTGTPTITALPNAPAPASQRIVYPAAGTIITHGGNISVQGNTSYTVAAGDELTITAITTTTFDVTIKRKDGSAVNGVDLTSNQTIAGVKTFSSTPILPAQSCVRLNTSAGKGSTNTCINRYTNIVTNQGTSITYASSATLGDSFTINDDGVYAISVTGSPISSYTGVSLNSTQLTTSIQSITLADMLAIYLNNASGPTVTIGVTLPLVAGDVIRSHGGTVVDNVGANARFTITRVA